MASLRPMVNVLDDGRCVYGHTIHTLEDTCTLTGHRGLFCLTCMSLPSARQRHSAVTAQLELARRVDEQIIDEVAIDRRIAGQYVPLTETELRIAAQMMLSRGVGEGLTARTLRVNSQRLRALIGQTQEAIAG